MSGIVVDFGPAFWREDRRRSGRRIDVLRGQNIPSNSRTIDRTLVPKGVVSHKSTDLRLKSYQSPASVRRLGLKFARDLRDYTGEVRRDRQIKATYHLHWAVEGGQVQRTLEWFVPATGVSEGQESALAEVAAEASKLGVALRLFRVKCYPSIE